MQLSSVNSISFAGRKMKLTDFTHGPDQPPPVYSYPSLFPGAFAPSKKWFRRKAELFRRRGPDEIGSGDCGQSTKTWMAGSPSAKTCFALLPGHDDKCLPSQIGPDQGFVLTTISAKKLHPPFGVRKPCDAKTEVRYSQFSWIVTDTPPDRRRCCSGDQALGTKALSAVVPFGERCQRCRD
jgi:hypothetical protein